MSVKASTWAWEQNVSAGLKLTLLAIADAANDYGYGFPGQARLADKCNCSERQIRRNVRQLEELGLLSISIRPGKGEGRHSNAYQLAIKATGRSCPDDRATGRSCPEGATGHPGQGNRTSTVGQPDIAMSYEPLVEPSVEPSERERRARDAPNTRTVPANNKRFVPPTLGEVERYVREKGLAMDAGHFHDHFTSNGWKVSGKAPMKDWKAAARNWARREHAAPHHKESTHERRKRVGAEIEARARAHFT